MQPGERREFETKLEKQKASQENHECEKQGREGKVENNKMMAFVAMDLQLL